MPLVRAILFGCICACMGACDRSGPSVALSKVERLARDRAVLAAARAASAQLPEEELLHELRAVFDASTVDHALPTDDGWILRGFLETLLDWNSPTAPGRPPLALDFERPDHPFATITRYGRELAERGIDLLLVPTTSRMQVFPDLLVPLELDAGIAFPGFDPLHHEFFEALIDSGVEVLDTLPAIAARRAEGEFFLRYNHHMSPAGIELVADLIAARLAEYPWYEPGPDQVGRDFRYSSERMRFFPNQTPSKMTPVEEVFDARLVTDMDGIVASVSDRASPILFIGDSSVNFFDDRGVDLLRHVYARTGHKLDDITIRGGQVEQMWSAIKRRGDALAGKRIVVWVFGTARLANRPWPYVDPF